MNLSRTTVNRLSSTFSTLAFREIMLPTSGMFSILDEGSTLFCSREKKTCMVRKDVMGSLRKDCLRSNMKQPMSGSTAAT